MPKQHRSVPWLPDRERLSELYEGYQAAFVTLLERTESRLKDCIRVSSVPTFKGRIKSFPSYYRKLLRLMPNGVTTNGDLPIISDIIGIRIICAFLEDLTQVERILQDNFTVQEVERKGADRTFREFGYESTHILLGIPDSLKAGLQLPKGLLFEIQVRTILQDAWAEVEHELVYKSEFSPFDLPLKRKLASINASLSLADIIFQEIRDYQNKLNRELDKRRGSFYNKADDQSDLHLSDDRDYLPVSDSIGDMSSPYVPGTIDDMILDAIEAHNRGDLDRAAMIYTKIIDAAPNATVLSVMYKHRGMAYFSQSRYEEALADFLKSAENNATNFRAYYYVGIVLGVMGRNAEACEAFTKSLELHLYQPYVYFRRAQSYFHLEMYMEALADLDKAVSLGYRRDDEQRLRIMITQKLDVV